MVPSGPPTPLGGGGQSVTPSLLRSNSALMGGQGGSVNSPQAGFNMQQRNQFNSMNMMGNGANVSSLLHQTFGNGGPSAALSGPGSSQRGVIDNGAESDPLSSVGNGMGFNPAASSFSVSNMGNPNNSGQVHPNNSGQLHPNNSVQVQGQQFANSSGNQMFQDQQGQQLESQNFQHNQQVLQQFPAPNNIHQQQQLQQQMQYQSVRGMSGIGPVKLEPQMTNDQHGQSSMQLQSMRNLGAVKLEPQQMQTMRGLAPVKIEGQHSDQSLYMHPQQQQQQQYLQMSRQGSQASQINQLHQQRLMLQQQQLLKANPQQRSPLQSQFQPQNLPSRSPSKPVYEPGMCARRLTHYMYQQQHRPEDNNIEFWRKFVAEYFAPNAKKKWCVSLYGNGRQTTGVFPQDVWHCEICNRKPGRGFEATAEVLPRLFKMKYESGTLEELLYVDMPREYQNTSGQIVLDYAKAIQESVFDHLRVVREGQLRLVFSLDLKICSWEFCARRHEELIPRRLLIPQVGQLGAAAQKYQAAAQNASPNLSVPELQNNCNMFVASARQLAKALEVPLVNDLGYTKRYVRCLQISEVVNSMSDLIDYGLQNGIGPMESLAKFPRRTGTSSGPHTQVQQTEQQLQQQTVAQNSNNEDSVQATIMQMASINNGIQSVNNSLNSAPATSSTSTIAGLLNQNPMNSRQQNQVHSANSPYGGGSQIPSPGSSATIPQVQSNHSPFQSPTPSATNNPPQTSNNGLTASAHISTVNSPNISMQQPAVSGDEPNDSQSSVQKIIHDMLMSSQLGGTGMAGGSSLGNEMKNVNRLLQSSNNGSLGGANSLVANGTVNGNSGVGVSGFGNMGNGLGARTAMLQNSASMNGRAGMAGNRDQNVNNHQQQDMSMLNGLGAVNGFNGLQFDWKSSP